MIDDRNFFDQPINSMNKTYENIRKIATGKGDDYTTGCYLDYPCFKKKYIYIYKMIAVDLSSQNELDADLRAIQQINFTANLDRAGNTTIFFIIEEAKETVLEFSQGTVKVNVKLSTSQLSKLKSAIKNENYVVIRISPNMIGDSNDKGNFPHELLLTDRQVSSIRTAFANNSSVDIKFLTSQLSKMIQSVGFLGKLLGPLLETGLPLIKSVTTQLAKSTLILLGSTAADAGLNKKILG